MNHAPGKPMRSYLLLLLLLPLLLQAQPFTQGEELNFRPQTDTNARGVFPPPVQRQSWSTQHLDGSRSYHQSWSYGQAPAYPGQPSPSAAPAAPAQAPSAPQGGRAATSPPGFGHRQQPWGAGFGPPQQPPSWPGQSSQQPSWPGGGYAAPHLPGWPGQSFAQDRGSVTQPRLEVRLAETRAYVHQNLVLTLEVISDANLSTLSVELPQTDAVVLRELGDTVAESRTRNGKREIVNRQHYQLTPLQSGSIEIPPLSVTGRMSSGSDYSTSAQAPIRLSVADADPSVRPWLPLRNLDLDARLVNDEQVAEGQPITLVLTQTVEGMSGAQLPSLEAQLRSPHHRIYREKTETDGRVDQQGRLIGSRIDHFTLVPQQGNRVQIPAVRVDWWNTDKQRKESALIPARLLGSGALFEDLSEKFSDIPFAGTKGWLFWLPMLLFAFLAGLYWSWVWARGRSLSQALRNWLGLVLHPLSSRLQPLAAKLSPQRQMHRIRRLFANLLPRSFRLWYCVRAADPENDPDDWAQVLRFLLNRRLGITAQRPMAQLADEIIRLHRPNRPEELRQLLRELEAGLFSDGAQIKDFAHWKRRFKRHIRPNPLRLLRFSLGGSRRQLPALNPTAS